MLLTRWIGVMLALFGLIGWCIADPADPSASAPSSLAQPADFPPWLDEASSTLIPVSLTMGLRK